MDEKTKKIQKIYEEIVTNENTYEKAKESIKKIDKQTYSKLRDYYFGIADNVDEFYNLLKKNS